MLGNLPVPDSFCPAPIVGRPVLSIDGKHLVVEATKGCPPNSRADYTSLFMSPDDGATIASTPLLGAPEGAYDPYGPIFSQATPLQVYTIVGSTYGRR